MTQPTKKTVLARIDQFLKGYKRTDGGYAPVDPVEVEQLHEIVRGLINLKYEADPDGDRPIEVILTDRTRFERPLVLHVQYAHKPADGKSELELLNQAADRYALLAKWATEALQRALEMAKIHQSDLVSGYKPLVLGGVRYVAQPPTHVTLDEIKAAAARVVKATLKADPLPTGFTMQLAWAGQVKKALSEKFGLKVLPTRCRPSGEGVRIDFEVPAFQARFSHESHPSKK